MGKKADRRPGKLSQRQEANQRIKEQREKGLVKAGPPKPAPEKKKKRGGKTRLQMQAQPTREALEANLRDLAKLVEGFPLALQKAFRDGYNQGQADAQIANRYLAPPPIGKPVPSAPKTASRRIS